MKIGVCSWIFPALGNPACCGKLAAMGVQSVLLDFGSSAQGFPLSVPGAVADWARETKKCNLEVDGVSIRSTKEHGFVSELGKYALDLAVTTARGLGARSICVPCNRHLASIEAEGAFEIVADVLRSMCRKTAQDGILITTENNLPAGESKRLLDAVGEPNLRLCLDPCNYVLDKGWKPAEILPELFPLADVSVHFKDGADGRGSIRLLGQGEGATAETLGALKALKFAGTAVMENIYADAAFSPQSQDPFMLLEKDINYVVSVLGN